MGQCSGGERSNGCASRLDKGMPQRISEESGGLVMEGFMNLRDMSRAELESLFEERKRLLIEVRDEIDRRDAERGRKGVDVDFCKYVEGSDIY